jgi:hypothetical protein
VPLRSPQDEPAYVGDRPLGARSGFLLAAAVVGAIVLAAVALSVTLAFRDKGTAPDRSAQAPVTSTGEPAPGTTATPTEAPTDVRWEAVHGVVLPYSRSAGPRRVDGPVAAGYTHTPTGALIAAAQLSTRASPVFTPGYETTVRDQVVPSRDRDTFLENLRAQVQVPPAAGETGQLAGFLFNSYTPVAATVTLAFRMPSAEPTPTYQVATFTVLWRGGDWRLVAPPGGSYLSVVRPAPTLTGFVLWSA